MTQHRSAPEEAQAETGSRLDRSREAHILSELGRLREFSFCAKKLLSRLPNFRGAHWIDIAVRRNGKTEHFQADYLRGLRELAGLEGE